MILAVVTRLYPRYEASVPLQNLYLNHQLYQPECPRARVYGSFLMSLDGRIAVEEGGLMATPKAIRNAHDWRLLQELHAQADCLITHAGYLRELQAGLIGNLLQVQAPDLLAWRRQQGLPDQPAVAIASRSLDFNLPDSLAAHRQPVHLFSGTPADPARLAQWQARGFAVQQVSDSALVPGRVLVDALEALGYRSLYLLSGPLMLGTMLQDGQLERLYLTQVQQLVGGQHFRTLGDGLAAGQAGSLRLQEMYLDPAAGQLLSCYVTTGVTDGPGSS